MEYYLSKTLSQMFEKANALSNVDFVEAHTKLYPESGAEWIKIAGTYVMFDGVGFPTTQTFGLGAFQEITESDLDEIEKFFIERKADVTHEVSPLADPKVFSILCERGYHPIEFTNAMYKPIDSKNSSKHSKIKTRLINKKEIDLFAEIATQGWINDMPEFSKQLPEFSKIGASAEGAFPFIAELEGEPIGTGTVYIYDEIAILAGASTIPEHRRKGAQNALFEARINLAFENGCKIAIMDAHLGSQSHRNAEKKGFQVAYTRTKWILKK